MALERYAQSHDAAKASGRSREVAETLCQRARTYQAMGDAELALSTARLAAELSRSVGDEPGVEQARILLRELGVEDRSPL